MRLRCGAGGQIPRAARAGLEGGGGNSWEHPGRSPSRIERATGLQQLVAFSDAGAPAQVRLRCRIM